MKPLISDRLVLRPVTHLDAPFVLKLLNEPSFIKNIRDSGVRTIEDAEAYIQTRYLAGYEKNGFGMLVVENLDQIPMGMCGLVKRDELPDVDVGYAFLPEFHGKGYALEAAEAALKWAKELQLKRVVAITTEENLASGKLLEKLGLKFEKMVPFGDELLKLYSTELQ